MTPSFVSLPIDLMSFKLNQDHHSYYRQYPYGVYIEIAKQIEIKPPSANLFRGALFFLIYEPSY